MAAPRRVKATSPVSTKSMPSSQRLRERGVTPHAQRTNMLHAGKPAGQAGSTSERFFHPPVEPDLTMSCAWAEVAELVTDSYRFFAPQKLGHKLDQ